MQRTLYKTLIFRAREPEPTYSSSLSVIIIYTEFVNCQLQIAINCQLQIGKNGHKILSFGVEIFGKSSINLKKRLKEVY